MYLLEMIPFSSLTLTTVHMLCQSRSHNQIQFNSISTLQTLLVLETFLGPLTLQLQEVRQGTHTFGLTLLQHKT